MKWLENLYQRYPVLDQWVERAKTISLPGLEQVPIYDVVVFFAQEIQKESLTIRAGSISFSFFLAIFPAIIFLFTLIPYIPVPNLEPNIMGLLQGLLPSNAFELIDQTAADIIGKQRGGLLSFGFFMAIYFATNGVVAIMDSFDKAYSTFKKRNFLRTRLVALKLMFTLSGLLVAAIILIIAGSYILEYLLEIIELKNAVSLFLFNLVRWVVILLLLFFSYSSIYYYGPAIQKKFKFISAGSTLATILTIVISLAFSYYVNNFAQYNKFYGSLGTIIALLLWFYLNAYALIIGFELNASIAINKNLRQEQEAEREEMDR